MIGTGIGGLGSLEENQRKLIERGEKAVSPLAVPLMMGNAAAAAVAMRHGLHGHSFGVVSACAAGAHAIGDASRIIRAGDADAVVTGGAEAAISGVAIAAFAAMGATSPTGISRPFDARRDGFVMGEGAGVLVLEEMEAARGARRRDPRRAARLRRDLRRLPPDRAAAGRHRGGAGDQPRARRRRPDRRRRRLRQRPRHLDPAQRPRRDDGAEAALGERAGEIPVSSTKSSIGHLLGAAGAVEAIATVEALRRREAPPTVGWEEPDEGLDLDYVPGQAKPIENGEGPLVAISNSFGFGGHNAVLCLAA